MSNVNNKKESSKSERNTSLTDIPDTKTNSSTKKTSVTKQDFTSNNSPDDFE